jgi:hypothetical protein
MSSSRWFGRWLLLSVSIWCAALAHGASLWFADAEGVRRLDTDTNTVTASIPQQGVLALALNQKDGALWALTNGELRKYDANGATLLTIDLKTLARNFNAARRLALDPSDDSLWVAGGSNAARLDSEGRLLASITTNAVVQDIVLAQDQSLWVLSRNELARYSGQGALLGSAGLAGDMQQAAFLALDETNGALWLAGAKRLFRIVPALPPVANATVATDEVVSGIALQSGTLWVAGQSSLYSVVNGSVFDTTDLSGLHLSNFQVLAFDAQSQSLWLGHEKGLSRFGAGGDHVTTVPAAVKVSAISAAPSGIVPIVTLVSPPDGALLRNAFVPIRLHYDASCFGQPCGFPPSTFAAYVLTATLNGQPIGGSFVFDPATNDAVFTPTSQHAQGRNVFTAFVTDGSGRRSRTITSEFTIDTIAPSFVNVAPADGATFASSSITLQGSLDDGSGHVLLENFSGAAVVGANPQGPLFSWAITLQPGSNAFRLTASDPAGNATQLSLTYVFSSLSITITNPANGAVINDNKVTVTGTFSGASTAAITVNGLPATVSGNSFTRADVPLQPGSNTITVAGTSPQGATDTKVVTVTSTAPTLTITSPANGAVVNGDSVLVRGAIQAVANSGVVVNGVVAAIQGNSFFAVVALEPGANTLTAKVTTPQGATESRSINVTASGVPPDVLATAAPMTGMAPLTVTYTVTNPTAADASYFLDSFGPFAVPAGGTSSLQLTYPEGIFTATIIVNGGSPQSFVISVTSFASMNTMLQALWSNVRSNLAAGNIEGALVFFAPGMRQHYRQVLTDIAPALPSMFATFPAIAPTAMVDGDAEYFVAIPRAGRNYGYFIYFTRDGDGVWRLHSL